MRALLLLALLGGLSGCATEGTPIQIPTASKRYTSEVAIIKLTREACRIRAERRNISEKMLSPLWVTAVGLNAKKESVATAYLKFLPIVVGGKSEVEAFFPPGHGLACIEITDFILS